MPKPITVKKSRFRRRITRGKRTVQRGGGWKDNLVLLLVTLASVVNTPATVPATIQSRNVSSYARSVGSFPTPVASEAGGSNVPTPSSKPVEIPRVNQEIADMILGFMHGKIPKCLTKDNVIELTHALKSLDGDTNNYDLITSVIKEKFRKFGLIDEKDNWIGNDC